MKFYMSLLKSNDVTNVIKYQYNHCTSMEVYRVSTNNITRKMKLLTLFKIDSANSLNARSILILAFALVSKNLIPCSLAIYKYK